jgi:uncharacterized protein DUF559
MSHRQVYGRQGAAALVRASRGVYGDLPPTERDRLRALLLRLPDCVVLGYHTAAALYGFEAPRTDVVHVIVPAGTVVPLLRGVRTHESVVPVEEPVIVDGLLCAPPARCAVDLARSVRRLDALPVLDAALRSGACDQDDLIGEVQRHDGLRGVRQARELVPLADGRSECRQESQLRLVLIDGGLPRPEPQVWLCDEHGVPRYRLDLGYERRKVGVEYDGMSHLDRARLRHDRTRLNWLHARGWTMRFFTDLDLYQRPDYIVSTVRATLR